jgi:hypothetical protein
MQSGSAWQVSTVKLEQRLCARGAADLVPLGWKV